MLYAADPFNFFAAGLLFLLKPRALHAVKNLNDQRGAVSFLFAAYGRK
jgi:hypothetical protein